MISERQRQRQFAEVILSQSRGERQSSERQCTKSISSLIPDLLVKKGRQAVVLSFLKVIIISWTSGGGRGGGGVELTTLFEVLSGTRLVSE